MLSVRTHLFSFKAYQLKSWRSQAYRAVAKRKGAYAAMPVLSVYSVCLCAKLLLVLKRQKAGRETSQASRRKQLRPHRALPERCSLFDPQSFSYRKMPFQFLLALHIYQVQAQGIELVYRERFKLFEVP